MIPRDIAREIDRLERQLRLLGGGTVRQAVAGGASSTDSTSLTDGCECNNNFTLEGVKLTGSPTVCCEGHTRKSVDLGSVLGVKTLYHAGGDIWSTFNADSEFDNPVEIECYPYDDDAYDVVLDLAAKKITLEARDTLNCDAVCFEYQRELPYSCKKANQFNLIKFSGASELSLPSCVCVLPATDTVPCANCEGGIAPEGPVHANFGSPSGTPVCDLLTSAGGDVILESNGGCVYTARVYKEGGTEADFIDYTLSFLNDRVSVTAHGNHSGWLPGTIGRWRLFQDAPHDCTQRQWSLELEGLPICSGWSDPLVVTVAGTEAPGGSGHCTECGA